MKNKITATDHRNTMDAIKSTLSPADQAVFDRIEAKTQEYLGGFIAHAANPAAGLESHFEPEAVKALRQITASADSEKSGAPRAAYMPTVTVEEGGRMVGYDLYSLLIKSRVMLLEGEVDETMASIACATLHYMRIQDAKKPIDIYINSPGGSVLAGGAIVDAIRFVAQETQVRTTVTGVAASYGTILSVIGDERYITPMARYMVHQASGGSRGQVTDMNISSALIEDMNEQLKGVYVRHTGLTHEFWDKAMERDTWFTPEQTVEIGLTDGIVGLGKPTLHEEFAKRSQPKLLEAVVAIPTKLAEIEEALHSTESAKHRGKLMVALSKHEKYWTPSLKKLKAEQAATAAPANQNTAKVKTAKAATPKPPGQ